MEGVSLPIGQIDADRVDMTDEQHGFAGFAAVKHSPNRGPFFGGVFREIAVVNRQSETFQDFGAVVSRVYFMT